MRRQVLSFWNLTRHIASQVCTQGLRLLESNSAHGFPDAPSGDVLLESNSAHAPPDAPTGAVLLESNSAHRPP
eukprot:3830856-Karenia_brevis.AAC.1